MGRHFFNCKNVVKFKRFFFVSQIAPYFFEKETNTIHCIIDIDRNIIVPESRKKMVIDFTLTVFDSTTDNHES